MHIPSNGSKQNPTPNGVTRTVGVNGSFFPKDEVETLNNGGKVTVNHKGEVVTYRMLTSGMFEFRVGSGRLQKCYGHPIQHKQGVGVPSAVDIFLKYGVKSLRISWAHHWRRKGKVH